MGSFPLSLSPLIYQWPYITFYTSVVSVFVSVCVQSSFVFLRLSPISLCGSIFLFLKEYSHLSLLSLFLCFRSSSCRLSVLVLFVVLPC